MERQYNTAKNEYETEDDDGRYRLVYAYFGLAIYFGQCLEETLSIMLWTDRIFKKTGGGLLKGEVIIINYNLDSSRVHA